MPAFGRIATLVDMSITPESAPATTAVPEAAAEAPAPNELWVERTGTRTYTGRSTSGATVLIADAGTEGTFTPGELLKIALAACTGMSTDVPLARRLGDNYDATVRVSGVADRERELYPALHEVLELDLSKLDPDAQERLITVARRAVDRVCTVGNTIKAGAEVTLDVIGG